MSIKQLLFIPLLILTSSFKSYKPEVRNVNSQNLNISFLLDLSDRIDPKKNPGYYQRDIQYIKSVQKAFTNHIKQKKVILLNDQMQVFFDPEPNNPALNKLTQQLKISFDNRSSKNDIQAIDKIFATIPPQIYQSAIKDGKFIGSDIWRFFKNKAQDYCVKENHRNILVIITDGYIYHQDSKFEEKNKSSYITSALIQSKKLTTSNYKEIIQKNKLGFIPAANGLKDLEVLVLGINPSKRNPYEGDVISEYWSNWLKDMGVKKFHLKNSDLPTNMDPIIAKIISNKN